MPIERKQNGFLEWHDLFPGGPPGLAAESVQLEACIEHFKNSNMGGWFGHPSWGFQEDNLDFLRQTPDVRWAWFWDIKLRDVSAVYDLTDVTYLGINPNRPGIDFSRLPPLETLVNHWNKSDTYGDAQIEQFNLWHCKPRSKSFEETDVPTNVKRMEWTWCNPASLKGLPVMPELTRLEIHFCRNLSDLTLLPEVAPNLERLSVQSSGKVVADEGVLKHPTLLSAVIGGNIVLDDRN